MQKYRDKDAACVDFSCVSSSTVHTCAAISVSCHKLMTGHEFLILLFRGVGTMILPLTRIDTLWSEWAVQEEEEEMLKSFSVSFEFTLKRGLQMAAITIGTHDGTFHCDEVLACSLLKQLPEYRDATIVRSRTQEVLDKCDIVVDVGAVFDPSRHRYDHHQRSFVETMNSLNPAYPWTTRLSSAGLVYFHFGKRVISQILGAEDEPKLGDIYRKVYANFIEEIDAIDNGIQTHDGEARYRMTTHLSARVGGLNPSWIEAAASHGDIQERFGKAMELVKSEFVDKVTYFANVWYPAKAMVEAAIDSRFEVDSSGAIISLGHGGCPWKEHLFAIEAEKKLRGVLRFVLFTDQSGKWRVMGVPPSGGSFELRTPLKPEWWGVRDEELSKLVGIDGAVFVHASGFIGGHSTLEGALRMAKLSLPTVS